MRKELVVAAALMMVAGTAWANEEGEPSNGGSSSPPAHVIVTVDAVLAVTAGSVMSADLGTMNVGTTSAQVCFQIDANQENVYIQAWATGLWKGDVMSADNFVIPVVSEAGALVEPASGNQIGAATNVLDFGGVDTINGLDALTTVIGNFESSQWGHFSQEVCVTIEYENENPELPQGEYSGWIKIVAGLQSW